MQRRIVIPFAALSLLAGCLLFVSQPFLQTIVTFTGHLLNKNLNFHFWKTGLERMGVELILLSANILLSIFFYKINPNRFIYFSCLSWIVVFIIYVIKDSVNIPNADDYGLFLEFLNKYSSDHDLSPIYSQVTESRMVIMHILGIVLFYLHAFDFRILTLFSVACLIGIAILLYKSILLQEKALLLLLIVILIFQFQYYNAVLLPSDALYSTCTVFYVFASMYLLNKNSTRMFLFASTWFLIAVLNCGSGFTAFISGFVLLLSQKRSKHLVWWILFSSITFSIYFYNYSFENGNHISSAGFNAITHQVFRCIIFSFAFLGSPFQFLYQTTLPIIAGGITWFYFLFLTSKKYYKQNPVVYVMLLFAIQTSILPALMRPDYSLDADISIRYGIYSITAICCCIIALFETSAIANNKKLIFTLCVFSTAYHLSTNIFFYPEVVVRKEKLETFIKQIRAGISSPTLPLYAPDNAEAIIKESVRKNIYTIPDK